MHVPLIMHIISLKCTFNFFHFVNQNSAGVEMVLELFNVGIIEVNFTRTHSFTIIILS